MGGLKGLDLLFRVDAGPDVGTGHFMRCLALGQAWKDAGGRVVFITASKGETLRRRLEDEKFVVHSVSQRHPSPSDWSETAEILSRYPRGWLALDGYHFDEQYQGRVMARGLHLLVIDDMAHLSRYMANLLLNQNAHARTLRYMTEGHPRLLLGTEYVLLRREFRRWQGRHRRAADAARRILVTLGGVDPLNLTTTVIKALRDVDMPHLDVAVVLGPENPHRKEVEESVSRSPFSVDLRYDVSDIHKLMAWADLALCSGGTSVWELAFMGIPSIVFATTEAEELLVAGLDNVNLFHTIPAPNSLQAKHLSGIIEQKLRDSRWSAEMEERGKRLVDGGGCDRVITQMLDLTEASDEISRG